MAPLEDALSAIAPYHPLVIEGPGRADRRDAERTARDLTQRLRAHWEENPPEKPLLLLTQGDPYEPQGIAALTRNVAASLAIPRGLAFLDEDLDPDHKAQADRENVILEVSFRALARALEHRRPGSLWRLERGIGKALEGKNEARRRLGKAPLPSYFHRYGCHQEVTKASARLICGAITLAHSALPVYEFSVTSLCAVGFELGLSRQSDLLR